MATELKSEELGDSLNYLYIFMKELDFKKLDIKDSFWQKMDDYLDYFIDNNSFKFKQQIDAENVREILQDCT